VKKPLLPEQKARENERARLWREENRAKEHKRARRARRKEKRDVETDD